VTVSQQKISFDLEGVNPATVARIINRPFQSFLSRRLGVYVLLLCLMPFAITALLERGDMSVPMPVLTGLFVLGGAGIGATIGASRRRFWAAVAQSPFRAGPILVELDDQAITVSNASFRTAVTWLPEFRVLETEEAVIVQADQLNCFVIPTKAFADTDAQAAFVAVIKAHISAAGSKGRDS